MLSCDAVTDPDAIDRFLRDLTRKPRPVRLAPAVQPYAWGGYEFIPAWLGAAVPSRTPQAELWFGSHPVAPARVTGEAGDAGDAPLSQLLERGAEVVLGTHASRRFGRALPYLLKILDVRAMLSIQAHPDSVQAAEGFAREQRAGVPIDAPHRNYRDANHKPEAMVAISEFWLLHGFRPVGEIAATLRTVPEIASLVPDLVADGAAGSAALRGAFGRLMSTPQEVVDRALGPLAERLRPLSAAGALDRSTPLFWAARAFEQFPLPGGHHDRGIVSIFLLNLARLDPGQGVFIPAGVLHAYLEGTAVEIMAASDNVLRGGLTPKHVDTGELLRVLRFDAGPPSVLDGAPVSPYERVYATPAAEFRISRIDLVAGQTLALGPVAGADTLLVVEGEAALDADDATLALPRGSAVLAPDRLRYVLRTGTAATIFCASLPAQG